MKSDDTTTISGRIRLLADLVGGPSALAGLLEVHPTTLFAYLSGKSPVVTARMHSIAAKFPCDLNWLMSGEGAPPSPDPVRTLKAKEAARVQRIAILKTARPGTERSLSPFQVAAPLDREVRLEVARLRAIEALKTHESELAMEVLGKNLMQEILAGRCCPSLELLKKLAEKLRIKQNHLLGLEE